jgi:hypothetical protein
LVVVAVLEDISSSRKKGNGVVVFSKDFAENLFQSFQGYPGQVFLVKPFVGKIKLFPKGFPVKEWFSVKRKDVVGGGQYGREIVDESSRPVKDEITNQWKRR